ncbi:hypothetical protein GCM10010917_07580 [Paenibacillus physcomitrellae]|uniref:Uncharacterized protein n=1 Tax=Paenibacillus physcomitrellae TaxID=1619311 RepID=A0ABQ1FPF0_9BACL|nr:hypothetical protein GCM10010917_07580 [Paenibacillus physcomitrellae]
MIHDTWALLSRIMDQATYEAHNANQAREAHEANDAHKATKLQNTQAVHPEWGRQLVCFSQLIIKLASARTLFGNEEFLTQT